MQKQFIRLLTITILTCLTSTKGFSQKISLLGERIKSKIVCDECNPGNIGEEMLLKVKTYSPTLTENSKPNEMAYQLLGRVYYDGDERGDQPTYCSGSNSIKNPFPLPSVMPSANTGSNGTSIKYTWKKKVNIDVDVQIQTDLAKIKALQPKLEQSKLDSFSFDLRTAYSKFANKEVIVTGKYFEYLIDADDLIKLAKSLDNYKECHDLVYSKSLRVINAIGLVYFDVSNKSESVDDIATNLQTRATYYGINFSVKFSFKQTISQSIEKFTTGYYQVVIWKSVTQAALDRLALNN